jgi:NADH:ubiquinone oxidoreductase subunit 6 (subunit J)
LPSSSQGTDYSSVYVFLGVLILLVIRRLSRVIHGSRVSTARTVLYSAYYLGFAGILIAVSVFSGGVSAVDVALYLLVGAVGLYGSYSFSSSRIGFWKGGDGAIYYRGALAVYLVYVAALISRIAIDLAFIGPQAFAFTTGTPSVALSPTAVGAGVVADVLLALGAGLLTGRNLRVMKRYGLIVQGKEQVGDAPPKITLF